MLIIDEKKYAEDLYCGRNIDIKSVIAKISYITRYLLHTLNYSDEDNYKYTVDWMNKYHNNFDESCYSNLISDAIKKAYKHPFYDKKPINITKTELEIISSLDNLRQEKVLFVLLCMAKHQSVSYGFTHGLVRYSLPELCKSARISVSADDREYILYEIVQKGFLGYPKKNNTQCLIVNFIDDDSEVVLSLNEIDCQELAYKYLEWKNQGKGYSHCEYCGKLIKQSKKNPRRFCEKCSEVVGDVDDGIKVFSCKDCGKPVYVDIRNNTKERCDECQKNADAESNRERQKRWYDLHKT